MKRALVFLLASPALITTVATLLFIAAGGPGSVESASSNALSIFVVSFVLSLVACGLDSYLARDHSVASRATRTSVCGAVIGGGLASLMVGCVLPQAAVVIAALVGGTWMSMCSLVASYYSDRQQSSVATGA